MYSQLSCFFRYAKWGFWAWVAAIVAVATLQVVPEWVLAPWWLRRLILAPAFTAAVVATVVMVMRDRYRSIRDICKAGKILFEMDETFDRLITCIGGYLKRGREFLSKVKALQRPIPEGITFTGEDPPSTNDLSGAVARYEADVVLVESLLHGVMSMRQKRVEVSGLVAAWFDMLHLRTQLSLLMLGEPETPRASFSPMPGADNTVFLREWQAFFANWRRLGGMAQRLRKSARLFAELIRDGKMVVSAGKTRRRKAADRRDGRRDRSSRL